MYIKSLELLDFRNYGALSLKFNKKLNIFLGENAQGKTNIIEAVYLAAFGKSFRTAKDNELIRFDASFSKVKISGENEDENIEFEITFGNSVKEIKVNGVKIKKISEILEKIYVVVFSPEDLKIVKDEPEKRRRFMDLELCKLSKAYFSDLSNYKRVLKQRNILLKDIRFNSSLDESLEIWDEKLAEYGARIIYKREEFIRKINRISHNIHFNISGEKENLGIYYECNVLPEIEFNIENESENSYSDKRSVLKKYEGVFLSGLKAAAAEDIKNGNTSVGPHKDDLKLSLDGVDLRHFGSQGQQRTAALALKLAELNLIKEETGEDAVLLLDDVLSELDIGRQIFLINSLGNSQIFITAAELANEVRTALPKGNIYKVSAGTVSTDEA